MRIFKTALTLCLLALSLTSLAQKPFDMNLWQGKPAEKSVDKTDTARVRVYLPNAKRATGRAVVICPGGGYTHLAMDHEGYQWGAFFNNMGIAAIVLKYRMPHGVWQVPAEDAEEAMRLVRKNAKQWHINTKDVGIMGFSAGGHLASTVATHATGDAMPNFQILFYPVISMEQGVTHQGSRDNLLGKKPKRKLVNDYCNEQHIGHHTPRAFLVLAHDDKVVLPINSLNYYEELYVNKVPASIHIYPTGGHGFGIRQSFAYHLEMMLELKAWLRSF